MAGWTITVSEALIYGIGAFVASVIVSAFLVRRKSTFPSFLKEAEEFAAAVESFGKLGAMLHKFSGVKTMPEMISEYSECINVLRAHAAAVAPFIAAEIKKASP